jgi:hypothetical protein
MRAIIISMGALLFGGCEKSPAEEAQAPAENSSAPAVAALPGMAAPASLPPGLMALPEDPAAVKRLADLGYTVHEDHLHAPGVKECPLMGNDPIM